MPPLPPVPMPPAPPPPPWWNAIDVPSDLTFSLTFYGSAGLLTLGLFCVIWPNVPVYRTRLIVNSVHTRPPVIRTGSDTATNAASALVCRFFGWTLPVFSTTADSFVSTAGLDAYMFGRVMQFGIEVFAMATLVGLGVVLPVNLLGKVVQDDDVKKHGNANAFTRLTMGNITNGSNLFFVHFFVVYVVVLWTIHCLRRMFCEYVLLRRAFLSKSTDQFSKANSVSVSPREEDEHEHDPDVEHAADDDTASMRAAETSKAAPGVSARLDKDLADFDGLFYDDISFVDPETGTESFINNVHRYVVLLRNVPRRKSRTLGDSTIGNDIAAYFSREVSRLTTRLIPGGLARAFSYPQRRHHYDYHGMNRGNMNTATSSLGAATTSWPGWLESLGAPSTLDNGMGGFAEEEEEEDIGADIDHIMEKVTAIFPRSEVAHVVPVLDGRRVDELMMQKYRLKQRLKRLRSQIAASSSSSSSKRSDEDGSDDSPGATASRQPRAKGLSCCVGNRRERQRVLADSLRASIARLRCEIENERSLALQNNTPTSSSATSLSYFVIFRTQQTAMMARQMLLFESDVLGQEYSIEKAPAPTDIIWDSIVNSGYPEVRALRVFLSNLLVAALVIMPVGAVSGGISTVSVLLCTHYDHRPTDDTSEALAPWITSVAKMWCVATPDSLRSFVTGIIPSLIIAYYGGIILPTAFYFLALSESVAISKAQVDRRIAEWYWIWSTINVFFSSLAGGSVLSQINIALAHPESIPRLLGTAIPKFSNFFINYIAFQGFVGNTILLLLPSTWNVLFSHQLWRSVARVLCCCCCCFRRRPRPHVYRRSNVPPTRNDRSLGRGHENGNNSSNASQVESDEEDDGSSSQTLLLSGSDDDDDGVAFATDVTQLRPQSLRYGREGGLTMLVFLIGIVYCIQSPIIAPVALMYFCGMWLVLRFHMLYVYVRSYESCGEMMFKYVAKAVFNSLKIMVTLMALLFLVYARWVLGVLLLMTLMPVVHIAGVDTDMRIMQLDEGVPLETIIRSESSVPPHHHHGAQNTTTTTTTTTTTSGSSFDSDGPSIPSELYMPSSLRRNGRGWAANGNMVWVNWNVPRHGL